MDEDILRHVKAIARFRNETERRTYYLLENGMLPAAKVGAVWEARKSRLLEHQRHLEDQTLERGRANVKAPTSGNS